MSSKLIDQIPVPCLTWPEAVNTQAASMLVAETTLATAKRKTIRKPKTRERQSPPGWLRKPAD